AGFGGLLGAAMADVLRLTLPDAQAFGAVFLFEASLFIAATLVAAKIMDRKMPSATLVPGE
ncbi:PucC family protein, partial [Yoonia sp.]|uniref:PucC family protein n=1 Tax=Yoonia sp. TaxID=2212373 RepID=UPI003A4E4802